ncbi:MAG: hypothetical protein HY861_05010 [Chlamydiia bacterium]|nr:hypothetical protein [Chlamydiia bacterium]
MRVRKIIGVVLVVVGAALFYLSHYINTQVAEGREKISNAQSTIDTTNSLFSLDPTAKKIGKQITGSAQKKIDAGKQEAAQYAAYAHWCMIGGIVFVILGVGVFVFGSMRNRRSS